MFLGPKQHTKTHLNSCKKIDMLIEKMRELHSWCGTCKNKGQSGTAGAGFLHF